MEGDGVCRLTVETRPRVCRTREIDDKITSGREERVS